MTRITTHTACHALDRLTLDQAYAIANGEIEACPTCTELAWFLVSADLDAVLGPVNA